MVELGMSLVMTGIGFAVSALFLAFVCSRLICAHIMLRRSSPDSPDAFRLVERSVNGLEPVLIKSFPTEQFGERLTCSPHGSQCVVCLSEYQEKDAIRVLPYCGHTFHVLCIDIWLKQNSTCPVCRVSLRASPDRKLMMPPMPSMISRSLRASQMAFSDPHQIQYACPRYCGRTSNSWSTDQLVQVTSCPFFGSKDEPTFSESSDLNANECCHETCGKHMDSPSNPRHL